MSSSVAKVERGFLLDLTRAALVGLRECRETDQGAVPTAEFFLKNFRKNACADNGSTKVNCHEFFKHSRASQITLSRSREDSRAGC
jgi:hypothetical protein